jgi:Flp pilus assembly protein TadD
MPLQVVGVIALLAALGLPDAWAGDGLKITIPRRSELTPVQRLNREGVAAIKKHQLDKAAALFYKAYLYDPADPFTLNNLGYISEVQGELDRAHKFYALASEQGSSARIDKSSAKQLEGKPMNFAYERLQDGPMRVNRMNVDAMALLLENRGPEAIALLKKALFADPANPFTTNNLGVAYETTGDYDNALREYGAASEFRSSEQVVVTASLSWRGRPVSVMAAESARQLELRIKKMDSEDAHAVMFTVHGVFSANQNDWLMARKDFIQAYSLDPSNAFSLNNRGYVAERDGDLETAQYFYEKARKASDSNARVGLATERSAEGKKLSAVAAGSHSKVDGELDKYSQTRRGQTGPIELTTRDGAPAADSGSQKDGPSSTALPATSSPSSIQQYPH